MIFLQREATWGEVLPKDRKYCLKKKAPPKDMEAKLAFSKEKNWISTLTNLRDFRPN